MKKLLQNTIVLFILTFMACKSKQVYQVSNLPSNFLEFGTHNTISDVKVSWIFLENGQVFYKNNLFISEQKQLNKAITSQIFAEANRVKRTGYKIRVDGTYLAQITLKSSERDLGLTWTWPYGGSKDYPDELNVLYLQINQALKLLD